jgi:hypothetical protein
MGARRTTTEHHLLDGLEYTLTLFVQSLSVNGHTNWGRRLG